MTGSTPVLATRDLRKDFGHVQALAGVSLELHAGEVVALVGDNGAGKSTLVAILSGVLQPDSGSIEMSGERVEFSTPMRAQDMGIATVFQDLALVELRDVAANLHLGREPRRFGVLVDRRRMLRNAADVVARLGVNLPSVRAQVGDLSGGQRQAVAISRAVLRGGQVMLMDEPTAALGVRESGKVNELIRRLREAGQAVLLISHNIPAVFELADRIVILRHGRVVANVRTEDTSHEAVVSQIVGAVGSIR